MGGNWTHLSDDLLIDIAKRLKCVEDIYSFSYVCSSWKSTSLSVKPKWTPAIPCLISPYKNTKDDSPCALSVFDLTTNKRCELDFPDISAWRYHDCGSGWIFSISPFMGIKIFNPLTKSTMRLPSAETLPHGILIPSTDGIREEKEFARNALFRRAILVNDEFLVLVVYDLNCLAFAKPGDNAWSYKECTFNIHEGLITFVEDVIVFNGKILIIFGDGKLVGVGLDLFLNDQENVAFEEYVVGDIYGDISIYAQGSLENFYLVESFGDVLVVLQHLRQFKVWFEVFKFDSRLKEWVRVEDLGDVSLFVGNHSAMAVCASNDIKCKPNCIYYIDAIPYPNEDERCGVGIFDLKSAEIEGLCLQSYPSPFWLMPKFM